MQIEIKTEQEIDSMRRGGKILGEILFQLADSLEVGMSTWDLEKKAESLFEEYNVIPGFKGYNGYPAILCTSVNNEVVHGIPNKTPLENGDIISIDCGVILDGLNTDSAIAMIVGENENKEIKKFVDTCIKALWAGISAVRPGQHIGDIGYAIQKIVKNAGYQIVPELTGHGIGKKLHEYPYVYNYGKPGQGPALKPGMTLAIEPIITMGNPKIRTLEDEWTIVTQDGSFGIQHEHTILVTESGVEVLTLRSNETMKA